MINFEILSLTVRLAINNDNRYVTMTKTKNILLHQ